MGGGGLQLVDSSSRADEFAQVSTGEAHKDVYCMVLCRAILGEVFVLAKSGEATKQIVESAMESKAYDCWCYESTTDTGGVRDFLLVDALRVYPEYVAFYKR